MSWSLGLVAILVIAHVLQGLVVARRSLERGDRDKALGALDAAVVPGPPTLPRAQGRAS